MSDHTEAPADVRQMRVDLAAALRLAERFDFHEGICNHFSAALPGPGERYLINSYGLHWSETGPDDLLMIDGDGTVLEGEGEVEATARFIHIAAHRANPRHVAVFHTHMPHATALTMVDGGRLEMAHQTATMFYGRIAYEEEFGGLAQDEDAGAVVARRAREEPDADIVFLAHHGVMIGAPSIARAFNDLDYLERACRLQVLAQSTGLPLKPIPEEMVRHTARQIAQSAEVQAQAFFAALKRLLPPL
jgi:ribulose-5-phosphate 4-epimerase/fuculose-1-phosphate aldolase